jgi:hypothetical protein
MATPQQQVIDAYLGKGFYENWQNLEQQLEDEDNAFFANKHRLQLSLSSPLCDRIYNDFTILHKIATDYRQGMNLVSLGRPVSKQKVDQVYDLYSLAMGVVDNENDILEAMWATGFAAAWVVFPFALLQAQAQALLGILDELKTELQKAEREVSHARNKRAFHLAVAFFEACFPEISLSSRAVIFLSDVVVDKALGPPDASQREKYVAIVTPGVKQFSEAVHHIPEYGHMAHSVAEQMGKVATAATFYMDYQEISEGSERVEKLVELTEKVKRGHEALVKVIEDNKPKLMQFLAAFDRWTKRIEDIRLTAGNTRKALADDIVEFGYSRVQPLAWPISP